MLTWPICMSMCCLFFRYSEVVGRRPTCGCHLGNFLAAPGVFVTLITGRSGHTSGKFMNSSVLSCLTRFLRRICLAHEHPSLGAARARLTGHDPHRQDSPKSWASRPGGGCNRPHTRDRTERRGETRCNRVVSAFAVMAWLFSLGIFDVSGGVDPHLAVTKLRLMVLVRFFGPLYSRPKRHHRPLRILLVARVVWVAPLAEQSRGPNRRIAVVRALQATPFSPSRSDRAHLN